MSRKLRAGQPVRFRSLIPNLLTIFAICAGLTAVRLGMEGRFEQGSYLIVLAMVLDAADGRVARYLNASSPFGAELDTLADFFNFGVAPGLLLYLMFFAGTEYANVGWLGVIALCVSCALRLARFNVALDNPVPHSSDFFVGVPAPALACLALMPVFLFLVGYPGIAAHPFAILLYLVMAGGLAISTLPTYSIKSARIESQYVIWIIAGSVLLVMLLAVYPWQTLIALNLVYLMSIPFSVRASRRSDEAAPSK